MKLTYIYIYIHVHIFMFFFFFNYICFIVKHIVFMLDSICLLDFFFVCYNVYIIVYIYTYNTVYMGNSTKSATSSKTRDTVQPPVFTCNLHVWPPIGMLSKLFHWSTSDRCAMAGWFLGPNLWRKFWRCRCPRELPPNGFRRGISTPRLSDRC